MVEPQQADAASPRGGVPATPTVEPEERACSSGGSDDGDPFVATRDHGFAVGVAPEPELWNYVPHD